MMTNLMSRSKSLQTYWQATRAQILSSTFKLIQESGDSSRASLMMTIIVKGVFRKSWHFDRSTVFTSFAMIHLVVVVANKLSLIISNNIWLLKLQINLGGGGYETAVMEYR